MSEEDDAITREDALALKNAAEAVRREVEGRFVTRRAFFAAMALVVVVLGALTFVALSNRALVDDLNSQTDLLTECTTEDPNPHDDDPHECFDDGQRRQAEVVEGLLEGFSAEVTRQIDRVLRSLGVEPVSK